MANVIGVVGGMGPEATVLFLSMVIEMTDAATDQEHVDLDCLMHASIPDRTAYILGRSDVSPVPPIQADLRLLADRGVAAVAIPCNTSHYFFDELQAACPVPILNMPELAAASLRRRFPEARRVAVLGTRGTVETGVYRPACERAGLALVPIGEDVQRLSDTIIYNRVKAGVPVEERLYLDLLEAALRAGADVVLLACTELSVAERAIAHRLPTVDAMVGRAEAPVLAAGTRLRARPEGSPGQASGAGSGDLAGPVITGAATVPGAAPRAAPEV